MDEIPADVRGAGYSFAGRYDSLQLFANADFLTRTLRRQDIIEKKAYIQSRSFDDVEKVASHLEDMAKSIPTLFPVCPSGVSVTSPFGYRLHPIFQSVIFHSGVDISGQKGMPIYAAADGVVRVVKSSDNGYGTQIDIDHGFGYSTRYAHLNSTNVFPGQIIHRGDQIATMGSTGRATGVHLHYEVLYKSQQINPKNFYDSKIDVKTYMTQVRSYDKLSLNSLKQ
jgi:murein DD-endopeptidase MepM/ murein hydrolase activator NlpD